MTSIAADADLDAAAPSGPLPLSKILTVGAGNALDFYDFLSFSFFAVQIGHTFFPANKTTHGLLFTLLTFGAGFLTRPLGGLILGSHGDRAGRKPAMLISFALMGAAILGLALTPGYAKIGIAAPILLVVFRLIQGFALGGEVGPSTAYLIEGAPANRRGLYVGVQYATQDLAVLMAGIVGFTLSKTLSAAALDDYGWRIAFLIGAAIVPFGLFARSHLPETFNAKQANRSASSGSDRASSAAIPGVPARIPLQHFRVFVLGILILGAGSITYYGTAYINTYCQDTLHLSVQTAFGATIMLGLVPLLADVPCGMLSDRVGRKPVMIGAAALAFVGIVPCFMLINRFPHLGVILAATAALTVLSALINVAALVCITESLPAAARSGVLGTLYAVAMAVFGGATQFVEKALLEITRNPLAPAYYICAALGVGLLAMILMRESAPARIGSARAAART
jgi:MFS family permease